MLLNYSDKYFVKMAGSQKSLGFSEIVWKKNAVMLFNTRPWINICMKRKKITIKSIDPQPSSKDSGSIDLIVISEDLLHICMGASSIAENGNAAFGIARKFVQTTGKLIRTSGTRSVCFTGSDVLGYKKHTTTKVNKNNRDLASTPLEKWNIKMYRN